MCEVRSRYDVVIVGGGLAGLTTAWRLRQRDPRLEIAVLEAGDRPGGKVRSEWIEHPDGRFLIESGPDAFLAQKPWARELAVELGLGEQLLPINQMPRGVSILRKGEVIDWPSGVSLVAPTELKPFAKTPLISWQGKARMALDLVKPATASDADESIASFVRRRMGQEAVDWIAEPLMAGIYSADPEELSLQATFPQLLAMEQEHGSLIRGLRSAKKAREGRGDVSPAPFMALRDGMQTLTDALAAQLAGCLHLTTSLTGMRPEGREWQLGLEHGAAIRSATVVLATPPAVAADLLGEASADAARQLRTFRNASSGVISLAFRNEQVQLPLPGYGLVIPAKEQRPFNAMTVMSRKFQGRAPDGWTLLRLFFGGARSPQTMRSSDADVAEQALEELGRFLGVRSDPEFFAVTRWPVGNPVYEVGHLDRVAALEASLPVGLYVTGSAYRGVGLPDVIRQANEMSERIVADGAAQATRSAVAQGGR